MNFIDIFKSVKLVIATFLESEFYNIGGVLWIIIVLMISINN